jgi:uncharacterized protein (TIGR03067 family)
VNAVFLGLAVAVGAPNLKEPPSKGLVGRWECTGLTISGKADPQWNGLEYEFTANGRWVIYRDGRVISGSGWTYKADDKAGPGAVDLCPAEGGGKMVSFSLFKVDGDRLTLSSPIRDGVARPADFAPAEGLMNYIFRRVQKKD